jgi:hypothetical protein
VAVVELEMKRACGSRDHGRIGDAAAMGEGMIQKIRDEEEFDHAVIISLKGSKGMARYMVAWYFLLPQRMRVKIDQY